MPPAALRGRGGSTGRTGHGEAACALVPAGATVAAYPHLAAAVRAPLATPRSHRGGGRVGRARARGDGLCLARRHAARDRPVRGTGPASRLRGARHVPGAHGRAELGGRGVLGRRRGAARTRRRRPLHRALRAARSPRRRDPPGRRPGARRVHRGLLRAAGAHRLHRRPRPGDRCEPGGQAAGSRRWRHRLLRQARGGAPATRRREPPDAGDRRRGPGADPRPPRVLCRRSRPC